MLKSGLIIFVAVSSLGLTACNNKSSDKEITAKRTGAKASGQSDTDANKSTDSKGAKVSKDKAATAAAEAKLKAAENSADNKNDNETKDNPKIGSKDQVNSKDKQHAQTTAATADKNKKTEPKDEKGVSGNKPTTTNKAESENAASSVDAKDKNQVPQNGQRPVAPADNKQTVATTAVTPEKPSGSESEGAHPAAAVVTTDNKNISNNNVSNHQPGAQSVTENPTLDSTLNIDSDLYMLFKKELKSLYETIVAFNRFKDLIQKKHSEIFKDLEVILSQNSKANTALLTIVVSNYNAKEKKINLFSSTLNKANNQFYSDHFAGFKQIEEKLKDNKDNEVLNYFNSYKLSLISVSKDLDIKSSENNQPQTVNHKKDLNTELKIYTDQLNKLVVGIVKSYYNFYKVFKNNNLITQIPEANSLTNYYNSIRPILDENFKKNENLKYDFHSNIITDAIINFENELVSKLPEIKNKIQSLKIKSNIKVEIENEVKNLENKLNDFKKFNSILSNYNAIYLKLNPEAANQGQSVENGSNSVKNVNENKGNELTFGGSGFDLKSMQPIADRDKNDCNYILNITINSIIQISALQGSSNIEHTNEITKFSAFVKNYNSSYCLPKINSEEEKIYLLKMIAQLLGYQEWLKNNPGNLKQKAFNYLENVLEEIKTWTGTGKLKYKNLSKFDFREYI